MKTITQYLILLLWIIAGCASANFSNLPKNYSMPKDGMYVENNKILHNGKAIAELRFYFTSKLKDNLGEAYLFSSQVQHRGLALYYYNEKKLVWIFPKDGRQKDIDRGYFSARGQTDGYVGWVYDVCISQNGQFIYYKKPALKSQSSFVFSVAHGASEGSDRDCE